MFKSFFSRIMNSPLLWGGLASFVFYVLLNNGVIKNANITRYCAMHPVEYAITTMFFVGAAALVIKFLEVRVQWNRVKLGAVLEKMSPTKSAPNDAARLLDQVRAVERKHGISMYTNRIYTLLTNIKHAESVEKLDDDFRALADDDFVRSDSDYGLIKMIIWAIPILGFLGTVIGIALAMGNLAPEALEESLPNVMEGLTIAFDTTALALALSMVLYFSQFLLWRNEQELLDEVNRRAEIELRGRFETVHVRSEAGELTAVRKMIEVVIESIEQLVIHQSAIWDQAMNAANSKYVHLASESSSQLKSTLATAMRESAEAHAHVLAKAEQHLLADTKENIKHLAAALEGNIKQTVMAMDGGVQRVQALQEGMIRQAEVFKEVVNATGQVARLEEQLNQNLATLAGARHFEETVNSLGAVIHLLNTKLNGLPGTVPPVQLPQTKSKGNAA